VSVNPQTQGVEVRSRNPQLEGQYELVPGSVALDHEPALDVFAFAEHLHKNLLVGAGFLVELASYLMLLLVVTAPLLAWPRLRHNLMGWHRIVGWFLLPLLVMLPLTGVMMSLHVGMPELPRMSQPGVRLSLVEALEKVQQQENLKGVTQVRRFRGGSVLIRGTSEEGGKLWVATDTGVTAIDPQENLVKSLHEGTWAGAFSGGLNLLGASALLLLILTGFYSWLRRYRRRSALAVETPAY
jgi:sulfite reductase (NADPH) flavoprotein alpha-component